MANDPENSPDMSAFLRAIDEAREAQTRYDISRQLNAEGKDTSLREEHIRFQQFVVNLFKLMRPYIHNNLPEYWENAYLYETAEERIEGLKNVHRWQGATQKETRWDGNEPVSSEKAALMPAAAIRNALDHLIDCAFELGFMPKAKKRRKAYNISVSQDDDKDPGHFFREDSSEESSESNTQETPADD